MFSIVPFSRDIYINWSGERVWYKMRKSIFNTVTVQWVIIRVIIWYRKMDIKVGKQYIEFIVS